LSYRTILASFDDTPQGELRLAAALALGARFDAHVTALCIGLQAGMPAYGFADIAGEAIAMQVEAARTEAHRRAAAARGIIERSGQKGDVRSDICVIEALPDIVAEHARFADLAIVGQPYGEKGDRGQAPFLSGVLFSTDTPALVVPPVPVTTVGRRVILAWNGTREAMRAIRRSVPLVAGAEMAELVLVDPEQNLGMHGEEPGADMALLLARHGIRVEVVRLPGMGRPVFQVLRERVRDRGADLLVMGAYGHSRLREYLLGGATRDMLGDLPVPVLMAH
jgi:nucleotide-binding universal stress UspA family protein